ncbi:MAG TPA: hypothetical protein VIY48_18950 [Candidatus Paceibacterota bacterium]
MTIIHLETDKWLLDCSEPHCFRYLTFNSEAEAVQDKNTHPCPWWGGDTKVSWSVTKTLVEQLWAMMDNVMDEITKGGPSLEYNKARARGLADATALFMAPFFKTGDEIVQEVVKRKKARDAGEEYETPGIGARRYESAAMAHASAAEGWYETPEDGYTTNPARAGESRNQRRTTAAPRRAPVQSKQLSPQEADAVRLAHKQMPQIFTVAVLAKQYGVSEAVVKEAVAS